MSWLRLQARGALVVLAAWAGLAAAQTPPNSSPVSSGQPTPPAAPAAKAPAAPAVTTAAERIVTVNESGKNIRCRIVQTWRLTDGSTAHKLQAVESGEFITIVDDPAGNVPGSKGLPKRIFHWGLKNQTPPPGVPAPPVPPELMVSSGVVLTQEINRPSMPTGSPYQIGAGTTVPGSSSPYAIGTPTTQIVTGPCTPSTCGDCAPGQIVSVGPVVNESSPTFREKFQSWLASRNAPAPVTEPKEKTVVAQAEKAPPKEKVLAISTPPSSAQPARPEIVGAAKDDKAAAKDAASKVTVLPAAPKTDVLASPEKLLKGKGVATAQDSQPTGLPPGAQSVLAARSGLEGPIAYVPVQTPVVPQPWKAPLPPDPRAPDAPQLNAFVNAFTPPPAPRGQGGPQVYTPGPMMAGGYGPMPGAMMNPYAMMMNPYAVPQPYAMPYGYPMIQAGYPYPMMPMMQQPVVPANSPRLYQGPQPPNPFGTNTMPMVQPVSYLPPMPAVAMPPAPMAQMPAAQMPAAAPSLGQILTSLRDAASPAEREMAASALVMCDWRNNPQVVSALVRGAGQDPAPTVRAGCVLSLMRMGCGVEPVMNCLQTLRQDADPRVREAVDQAMIRLGQTQAAVRTN